MLMSCDQSPETISPYKTGDVVYFKLDSSKAVIVDDLGKADENGDFYYRISKKEDGKIKYKWFISSSELFKK